MTTVLNPAPIDMAILDPQVLALVDVLTPNHEEARALAPAPAEDPDHGLPAAVAAAGRLRLGGVRQLVVTLGPTGCLVASDEGCFLVPAPEVTAVDTVGAGDAFNGALAVALAEGRPLVEAAAWACAAGALAVTRPGAQGGSPQRGEIDRLAAGAAPPQMLVDV